VGFAGMFRKDSWYANVSYSDTHVFCKKDVTWLQITMNYWWLTVIMKIVQSIHDITISSLRSRLSVFLRVGWSDFGWSQSFKLPFGMNSKTSALNSWPWWLMLEQQVMIFMRHRCRTLLRASHSVTKLLVDPDFLRLKTFMATIVSSSWKVHL